MAGEPSDGNQDSSIPGAPPIPNILGVIDHGRKSNVSFIHSFIYGEPVKSLALF